MSNQILQAGRALAIIPSDNAPIPSPAVVTYGINSDAVSAGQLVDPNADFIATHVAVGDVIYNTTSDLAATITQVVDINTLNLNADIFTVLDQNYIIYQQSPQTGSGNTGCVLYVGGLGDLAVTTTGNDDVTFVGINAGSFIPVHILKIKSTGTTATNILALW